MEPAALANQLGQAETGVGLVALLFGDPVATCDRPAACLSQPGDNGAGPDAQRDFDVLMVESDLRNRILCLQPAFDRNGSALYAGWCAGLGGHFGCRVLDGGSRWGVLCGSLLQETRCLAR